MVREIEASLPSDSIYVSGSVNGTATTWTNTHDNVWQTVADRATDDIYHVELTVISTSGQSSNFEFTLYYGIQNLITDRIASDVEMVDYLSSLWYYDYDVNALKFAGTDDELGEWNSGLKGAYNAVDLNRVGAAVSYVANRINQCGYIVEVDVKQDWKTGDIPTISEMETYLDNVREIRAVFPVFSTTPTAPDSMGYLDYNEANNIEQILIDVNLLIDLMSAAWYYSGELYSGEVV